MQRTDTFKLRRKRRKGEREKKSLFSDFLALSLAFSGKQNREKNPQEREIKEALQSEEVNKRRTRAKIPRQQKQLRTLESTSQSHLSAPSFATWPYMSTSLETIFTKK